MALIKSRGIILAKEESTYDTDPTPTGGSDAIHVESLQQSWPSEVVDRDILKAAIGKLSHINGRKMGQLTFRCPIKGSGTAGTAPDVDPLLKACGFAVTNTPATSDVYAPVSTSFDSCTIYVYRDGLLWQYTGCRGTFKIVMPIGGQPMYEFTMMGHVVDPSDAALPGTITVDATVANAVLNTTFTMGGYAAVISSLELDIGNQLTFTDDMNDASGYGEVVITDRIARGSFDPEMELVATEDYWSRWEDGDTEALSMALGGTAGNIVTIAAPYCHHREMAEGERAGVLTYEIPFSISDSSGDDELTITYT